MCPPTTRPTASTPSRPPSRRGSLGDLEQDGFKAGGDRADWATSVKDDAFEAFSLDGVINTVSAADISVLDLLGYNPKTPPAASAPVFAQAAAAMAPRAASWQGHRPATPLPAHAMLARPAIA